MRALIRGLIALIFLKPLNRLCKLLALLRACHNAQNQTAMVDQAFNCAIELTEVFDLRAHPVVDRTSDRGNQCYPVRGYPEGTTRELLRLAPHSSAVPERVPSRQADGNASLAARLIYHQIIARRARHATTAPAQSVLEECRKCVNNFFIHTFSCVSVTRHGLSIDRAEKYGPMFLGQLCSLQQSFRHVAR